MKNYFLVLLAGLLIVSCKMDDKAKSPEAAATELNKAMEDPTTVQMIDTIFNFGKITDGEKVEYSYRFKNTGNKPLLIGTPYASCGCTIPESPEKPVLPGETAFIKVVFNSKGKTGNVSKTITVPSNANPAFPVLILSGEVLAPNK